MNSCKDQKKHTVREASEREKFELTTAKKREQHHADRQQQEKRPKDKKCRGVGGIFSIAPNAECTVHRDTKKRACYSQPEIMGVG